MTKKDENVPEEVRLRKKFTLKELSEIFHGNENAKDKMLETDPNSEWSTYDHSPRHKKDACFEKKTNTVQTTLDKLFYKEIKLKLSMFLMF